MYDIQLNERIELRIQTPRPIIGAFVQQFTVRQMHREFRLQAVIHSFIHTRLINTA